MLNKEKSPKIYLGSNFIIRALLIRIKRFLNPWTSWCPWHLLSATSSEKILSEQVLPQQKKLYLLEGWLFRDYRLFTKYQDQLRQLFSFSSEITARVQKEIEILRGSSPLLVIGLHIRRGDYQLWQEGKYYYSDEQYISVAKKIIEAFSLRGMGIKILICSNEKISVDSPFIEIPTRNIQKNEINDLCLLSHCDYIVGPPSSFSSWASFIGKVPLLHIEDPDQQFTFEQFRINMG
jgi:hypothetical protein